MNYLKSGTKSSDKSHEAMEMARPLTPKSERRRSSYGSLEMSLQTLDGLCTKGRKCVFKDGHTTECWPN